MKIMKFEAFTEVLRRVQLFLNMMPYHSLNGC